MPFHLSNSLPTKYSSIEYQKIHEYEYKKYLKTLKINTSEQKLLKHRQIYSNNNYLFQREMNMQSRQDKQKTEYERIQKENLKFSQRLINAKTLLNRHEQQLFFDKHCKLKQRLQHYPDFIQNQTKKSDFQLSSINHFKTVNKPIDSSFLIYNDNVISQKSMKLREIQSKTNNQMFITKDSLTNLNKPQIAQKKLPHFIKHNSQLPKTLPSIQSADLPTKTSEISNIKTDPSINIINWNKSTNTPNLPQPSSTLKLQCTRSILSSQSSSTSESDLLI